MKLSFAGRTGSALSQALYGYVSSLLQAAQGILIVPVAIAAIGPANYGLWLASGGFIGWLSLVDIGVGALLVQRCSAAHSQGQLDVARHYFLQALRLTVPLGGLIALIAVLLAGTLPAWLGVTPEQQAAFSGAILVSGVSVAIGLAGGLCRDFAVAMQRHSEVLPAALAADGVSIGLMFGGLWLGWGVWSFALAHLARGLVLAAACGFAAFRIIRPITACVVDAGEISSDIRGGLKWTLIAKVAGQFAAHLPAVLITKLATPVETVCYIASIRPALVLEQVMNQGISSLYSPFAHAASGNRPLAVVWFQRLSLVLAAAALLAASLYAFSIEAFIGLWIGREYFFGGIATAAVALYFGLGVLNRWANMGLLASGDIARSCAASCAESCLRLLLIMVAVLWMPTITAVTTALLAATVLMFPVNALLLSRRGLAAWSAVQGGSFLLALAALAGVALLLASHVRRESWLEWALLAGLWAAACAALLAAIPPVRGALLAVIHHLKARK